MEMSQRATLANLSGIFFLSGFSALIYQICWQWLLFTGFGIDLTSITVIVSVFMMGLGCGAFFGGRIADVMGFRADASILIECKTSRSDFLADKNKPERRGEIEGYGNYRLYLAPKGILKLTDLPVGWGLLEVNEKNKVEITHFKQGNIYCTNTTPEHLVDDFFHTSCSKKERSMLYSILISKKKEST